MPNVELEEVSVLEEVNELVSDEIEYPAILIEGVNSKEELNYFVNRGNDPKRSLPLYLKFDSYVKRIGQLELSLNTLLTLRVFKSYKITLFRSAGDSTGIDVEDDQTLIKFISI